MNTKLQPADALVRLRRLEGQIRGIQHMLEEDRGCEQLLTQLMAVRAGIDQVGLLLMETHIEKCLLADLDADPERLQELRETLKMWARFGLLPGAALPWLNETSER
ncbi:MAG: metal-sensitive transcriptional regulator [Dehalococcoidia bacterium]|jgi:DNA-binding FrmR family transcriptional regulator